MPSRSAQTLAPKKRRALAEDLAQRIVACIGRQNPAAHFIENYAQQYARAELVIHGDRNRELQSIFEREILLAMLVRIATTAESSLQGSALSARNQASPLGNSDQFLRVVLEAIGRQRGWTAGDIVEITGELNLYREVIAKSTTTPPRTSKSAAFSSQFPRSTASGPFVDRCAFVLDPSMMENARIASAKFLREIESLADKMLEESFSAIQSAK